MRRRRPVGMMTRVRGIRLQARSGLVAAALCLVPALAWTPDAVARVTPIVPPSNGAGNVYLETLPGPGGNQQLGSGSGGSVANGSGSNGAQSSAASGQRSAIGTTGLQTLTKSGESGRVVRGLAPQSHSRALLSTPAGQADSPAGSVGKLIEGHGRSGLGIALPLILGAAAVAAIAFAVRHRSG